MIIGIVGSEATKFSKETEKKARDAIRNVLANATVMCSGHCHLGGIDIWAEEEADRLGIEKLIFPPKTLNWTGFRRRNLLIAGRSDRVVCISVKTLPSTYRGMTFTCCYHCDNHVEGCKEPHIKSGGCWTALRCAKREWIII